MVIVNNGALFGTGFLSRLFSDGPSVALQKLVRKKPDGRVRDCALQCQSSKRIHDQIDPQQLHRC
jgi:hypothetical protein